MKTRKSQVNDNLCPKCGASTLIVQSYSDTVDFRGLELDVENLQRSKCGDCAHTWTTDEQQEHNNGVIRTAYATQRDKLRIRDGLLGGAEIGKLRARLGLTQREAAVLFGGGYNAFNKYESGEVLQSFAMDRLLRLVDAIGRPAIEFLKDVSSPPQFIVMNILSTSYKAKMFTLDVGMSAVASQSGTATASGTSAHVSRASWAFPLNPNQHHQAQHA